MQSESLEQTINHLKAHPKIQGLLTAKVGLVLSGGGGKGAYQAGCLDVLDKLGMRFCVISGVSVGALNAAAVGCGKVAEVVKLWDGISPFQVLHLSWKLVPAILCAGIASLLMLPRTLGCLPSLFLFVTGTLMSMLYGSWTWLIAGIALAGFYEFIRFYRLPVLLRGAGWLVAFSSGAVVSLSQQSALRATLKSVLWPNDSAKLDVMTPTFITTAAVRQWFDPDFPSFGRTFHGDWHLNTNIPVARLGVLPEYWNIANQPQKRLLDLLIESASIPVVFQSRKTGEGMLSFDGGVVENVPLNKALEFNCDYVVVIYLEANRELPAQILTQIPKLRRALALQTLPLATAHKMYLDWLATVRMRANLDKGSLFHEWDLPQTLDNVICPIEPLTGLPSLIHVVPTKSLGNFVTGTLNFFSWKSRNLIQLGRRDMISTLRSFCEGA